MTELFMAWLSGARKRVGYGASPYENWLGKPSADETARDNFFLTKNVITPRNIVTDANKNFYLLEAVGLTVNETHMELFFGEEDFFKASVLLKDIPPDCKKVTLGIGASIPTKKYPVEKYLVALRELAKKNFVFVIVGGKDELDEGNFLEKNLPRGRVLNLAGKTTLRETEAIISQTDFYLGNDTATLHIAAAHLPCLVLYRGAIDRDNILPAILSEFQRFPPWQTKSVILRPDHPLGDCATLPPVYGYCCHLNEPHCITQITPQEIITAFETLQTL